MDGIPIILQLVTIKIYQFGKQTDKPILYEKLSIPQVLNIDSIHNENHWNDDYGMREKYHNTLKHENRNKQNNSEEKEQKATVEELQSSFAQKSRLREGTWYCCRKPRHISPDCP